MIGIFDSGFGGLTVLKEILKELPDYSYVYLGDNARAPYGARSQEVIYNYTQAAVEYLFKQGCQLIVLACNTASSEALRKLQQEYLPAKYPDRKILGVIIPLAEEVIQLTKTKRVGVIGTKSTMLSEAYRREIKKLDPKIQVLQQACPLLVPLIEEGWQKKVQTKMILKTYLRPLKQQNIDTLILGCTHYQVLADDIKRIMGPKIIVPNSGQVVAKKLADYLQRHPEIGKKLEKKKERLYLTTDAPEKFSELGSLFLGQKIKGQKIQL